MEYIEHTYFDAYIKWKKQQLSQEVKEKVFNSLKPFINNLIKEKTLTEQEKQVVEKDTPEINIIINKHNTTINSRNLEE